MAYTLTREDSQRGAEVSNALQETERANLRRISHQTYELVTAVETGDIGQTAYETALEIIEAVAQRTARGLPLTESIDVYRAAQVAETIFKIHRLATGQSTSNQAHAAVDPEIVAERRAVLQARLNGTDVGPVDASST